MHLFFFCLLQSSFFQNEAAIPICYTEFIGTEKFVKSDRVLGVQSSDQLSLKCSTGGKSFKLKDYYNCEYLDSSNKLSIELSIFLAKKDDFQQCYINTLEEHVSGNQGSKWATNFLRFEIDSTTIYQVEPSSVMDSIKGPLFAFFTNSRTLVRVSVSKQPGKKTSGEEDDMTVVASKEFVRLLLHKIDRCDN